MLDAVCTDTMYVQDINIICKHFLLYQLEIGDGLRKIKASHGFTVSHFYSYCYETIVRNTVSKSASSITHRLFLWLIILK